MVSLENLLSSIQDRFRKLSASQKRGMILFCTGVFAVILILSAALSSGSFKIEKSQQVPERASIRIAIPPGEIFFPDEPDFLPGVMLGRERRTSWTELDASEYWQDPLREGEEPWREMIETAINELLERIP